MSNAQHQNTRLPQSKPSAEFRDEIIYQAQTWLDDSMPAASFAAQSVSRAPRAVLALAFGAMKAKPPPKRSSEQAALLALFRAIAIHDHAEAARMIKDSPQLAALALQVGASRSEPSEYFFVKIGHYAYAGDTSLHLAAAAYDRDTAERLIASGAPVDAKNRRGAEPLHYAADGSPDSPSWDPGAQSALVEFLIRAGANPDAVDSNGVAPLHRAVRTRCASAVRALLANRADVRLKNKSGSTALHLAVQSTGRGGSGSAKAREQQVGIIGLLLAYGARGSDEDAAGTPVIARVRAAWVAELLRQGANP